VRAFLNARGLNRAQPGTKPKLTTHGESVAPHEPEFAPIPDAGAAAVCAPAAILLSMERAALVGGMPVVGWESSDRFGDECSGQSHGCEKRKKQLRHDALHEGNGSQKPVVEDY
jgi:hypothetical protein